MASEPASLIRGTEVSAKYKGAFCEATVKEVKKVVKCRVNFKGKGTHTISDEHVRSDKPLKVSALVEAKHPDGTYSEGTIVKITDASLYTVVFDDGDERTLRRTSLCLKGEKHYDETETLNHLPLTNPEYFGTPVFQGSGSGKKGRKRRRLSTSSIDDEVEDEASELNASKRLNFGDSNVGKVVFIENGERRRNAWIPALIVPRSLAEDYDLSLTDQCLVRSFKDGKFCVVQRSEMQEFSKDSDLLSAIERGELPGNKQANELAVQYVESGKLPWDMQLEIRNESMEDDEEYHDMKEKFLSSLYTFMSDRGSPIEQAPLLGSHHVDLCRLYHIVKEIGGMNEVTKQMKWPNVVSQLNVTISAPASSATVKLLYRKYLYPFEAFEDRGTDNIPEHEESPLPEEQAKTSPAEATDSKESLLVANEELPSEIASPETTDVVKEETDQENAEDPQDPSDAGDKKDDSEQGEDHYSAFDNIKVRYGRGRASTIYEAKIKDIKKVKGGVNYLVHYPGWNSRFDEWIRYERIEGRSTKPTRRRAAANHQAPRGRGRGAARKARSLSVQAVRSSSPSLSSLARSGRRERRSSMAGRVPDSIQRSSRRRRYSHTQPSDSGKDAASDVESKPEVEYREEKEEMQESPKEDVCVEEEKPEGTATEETAKTDVSDPSQPTVTVVVETPSEVTQPVPSEPASSSVQIVSEELKIREAAMVLGGLQYPSPHSSPDSREVAALSSRSLTSLSSDGPTVSNGETSQSPDDTSSGSSLRAESNETPVDVDDSVPSPEFTKPSTVGRGRGRGRGRRRGGRRRGPGSKLSRRNSDLSHRLHGSMSSCSSSANSDSEELGFSLPDLSADDLPPNPKYIVDFTNTSYSATERIDILRTKIDEMRQEYASFKTELLTIDRKRKRARKRMRDRQKALAEEEEGKAES